MKVPVAVTRTFSGINVGIGSFIPASNIFAPAGTVSGRLILSIAADRLASGLPSGGMYESIEIPFNKVEIPANEFRLTDSRVTGTSIVTAAGMVYCSYKNNCPFIIEKRD